MKSREAEIKLLIFVDLCMKYISMQAEVNEAFVAIRHASVELYQITQHFKRLFIKEVI